MTSISPRHFHVSVHGSDQHPGTCEAPFRTIQAAAEKAGPSDTITVHAGVYREWVNPPRGGESDESRILFQAAAGEDVWIKGSEQIQQWEQVGEEIWTAHLPESFFGTYNPYRTEVGGNWFRALPDEERIYHTGAVYLNGHWLKEAVSKDALSETTEGAWFGETDSEWTVLTVRFPGVNPNEELVEINVRETVFYPEHPGCDFIHVKGFHMEHAACNWAPPTAEQVGLIGTHWSKGWIIEDNLIRYAMCSGITLGKYGDDWDNRAGSAEGYVGTIRRAHEKGWRRGSIGHHVVQDNEVAHCEQAGIVGSMGCAFSTIQGNHIHHINIRGMFAGEEMAGLKFHGPIDSLIAHNRIHDCAGFGGMWLDWMTQGTRVHGNLFYHNQGQDLFVEVNHGPFIVDHNLFLSPASLLESSGGGAYVHNLFAGRILLRREPDRDTPCHPPHSTEILKLSKVVGDDERFINNLFAAGSGLQVYAAWEPEQLISRGNIYLGGARPSPVDEQAEVQECSNVCIEVQGEELILKIPEAVFAEGNRIPATSALLGTAAVSGAAYLDVQDQEIDFSRDLLGRAYDPDHTAPGPFAAPPGSSLPISRLLQGTP